MHIREATINIIKSVTLYKNGKKNKQELIKDVCSYFDIMKNQELQQQDLIFLKYLASFVGIPHFYDMLAHFGVQAKLYNINLMALSAIISESTLYVSDKSKMHRYQKQVYDMFSKGACNRYFLSASTSFGKTHLVFDIIRKQEYKNIVLLFPTIALLSENYERLLLNHDYEYFKNNYKIHTLSEIEENDISDKNIFIYTPERFLSYIEKSKDTIHFDFVFIDEIYKIDNEYVIDETLKENERDTAYRIATHFAIKEDTDVLLAGPYIEMSKQLNSFGIFLKKHNIKVLNYNDYEIVNKSYMYVGSKSKITISDKDILLNDSGRGVKDRLYALINGLLEIDKTENVIIYCPTRIAAEKNIKSLYERIKFEDITDETYLSFLQHIKTTFGADWGLYKALSKRIAFHHGLVPKYIQKEIINLFNRGEIKILASTTTITEGVNTTAKNIIITSAKKEKKMLKKFDAQNIAGRAGRFLTHYSGRVFTMDEKFDKILAEESTPIKHKNYDIEANKSDVDLDYTDPTYCNKKDLENKHEIEICILNSNLPDYVLQQYKVISKRDKVNLYYIIKQLSNVELQKIAICINKSCEKKPKIYLDGFQIILETLSPFIKNNNLNYLINNKGKNCTNPHSTLAYLINAYLNDGFNGLIKYKKDRKQKSTDTAIRETADFVYNVLKYHVVKYLGLFNIIYKYHISQLHELEIEDITGLDKLIAKLEYNAFSKQARAASDYGATNNIIEFFEENSDDKKNKIMKNFDSYETKLFKKIKNIMDSK